MSKRIEKEVGKLLQPHRIFLKEGLVKMNQLGLSSSTSSTGADGSQSDHTRKLILFNDLLLVVKADAKPDAKKKKAELATIKKSFFIIHMNHVIKSSSLGLSFPLLFPLSLLFSLLSLLFPLSLPSYPSFSLLFSFSTSFRSFSSFSLLFPLSHAPFSSFSLLFSFSTSLNLLQFSLPFAPFFPFSRSLFSSFSLYLKSSPSLFPIPSASSFSPPLCPCPSPILSAFTAIFL